ncbi:uncharacterized protein zgc:194981 [Electrophorus electricus]|uniref:Cystatin domain-containing protein n=1 Tax=Electrophorus electricus TaxID=8005 RepID=A0A4W4E3T2_ELEEL|nr:uncharacterized protein zgc:194981 [Electrophorus electricus]XP_035388525.1 uncharacterized protein zgc:194981 [Electrophorus electricus]
MTYVLRLFGVVSMAHIMSGRSYAKNVNPDVIKVASFAIHIHNHMSNYPYAYKVVDILSDTAKLCPPARIEYSIAAKVAETTCINNGTIKPEDCSLKTNAQTMICNFVVLALPGRNTVPNRLLSDYCT